MKTKKNNEMKKKVKSIVTAVTIVAMMMPVSWNSLIRKLQQTTQKAR